MPQFTLNTVSESKAEYSSTYGHVEVTKLRPVSARSCFGLAHSVSTQNLFRSFDNIAFIISPGFWRRSIVLAIC